MIVLHRVMRKVVGTLQKCELTELLVKPWSQLSGCACHYWCRAAMIFQKERTSQQCVTMLWLTDLVLSDWWLERISPGSKQPVRGLWGKQQWLQAILWKFRETIQIASKMETWSIYNRKRTMIKIWCSKVFSSHHRFLWFVYRIA